jgi:AAA+ ATPase superfamily predicted ATPase
MELFFGRSEELLRLKSLTRKKTASLVVCLGRRRVGKSRLIQEFAKEFDTFIEIQGLAPRHGQTNQDQLDHFAKALALHFRIPALTLKDWSEAFYILSKESERTRCLIFLDEISWMGAHDSDFPGKLKISWDTQLKKNSRLCLALCGSVSSWIQKNILASTDFVGRISLELHLRELPLRDSKNFWIKEDQRLSELDKLRFLCVTGGVPRYLEEMNFKDSFRENIQNLCFHRDALFLDEFQKIFSDIFGRRSEAYRKIVTSLLASPLTATEISRKISKEHNGKLGEYLKDLELSAIESVTVTSGFI